MASTGSTPSAASALRGSSSSEHALSLKVMRVTHPAFAVSCPIVAEDTDVTGACGDAAAGLSTLLTLPHTFPNAYLGETFSSYITLCNTSDAPVYEVVVKAELQTSSQLRVLLDTRKPIAQFAVAYRHDFIVSHEFKELGFHVLVCSVQYALDVGHDEHRRREVRHFKKYFRFPVLNPLQVNTKIHAVGEEAVYLEAHIGNASLQPLCLDRVDLHAVDGMDTERVAASDPAGDAASPSGVVPDAAVASRLAPLTSPPDLAALLRLPVQRLLQPGDTRLHLFRLTPRDPAAMLTYQRTGAVGKLDLAWRTAMGEVGRLQTSQLARKVHGVPPLECVLDHAIAPCLLEHAFTVPLRLTNRSDRRMDIQLHFIKSRMGELVPACVSGAPVASLAPGEVYRHDVRLFALSCGVHRLSGVRLVETSVTPHVLHDFPVLGELLVVDPSFGDASVA